ncbi:MAG TPA: LytTR family DNA-binding domain-containing protein [Gemmatimonadaceae bacterium]
MSATSPLRALVVDDEPLVRERIGALVRTTQGLELVGEAENGLDALNLIDTLRPDLLFIDVEMPELSGFGVIAAIEGEHVPGVVFVTAFEHYALKAFDVGAIDYLHKPVTADRFSAAVQRAMARLRHEPASERRALVSGAMRAERERGRRTRYVVRRGKLHYFVPVDQIDWIDSAENYLQLHVGGRSHLARGTLKEAEEELDAARFVRIHRSTIVAIDRVTSVRRNDAGIHVVQLRTGERLRASRQYADRVRRLLR